ncbi:AAA-like domain protein [[Clostridium] bifermentans ATCC 19299]|uniref:ATPase AAA n=1 Tax=Paraclostridium bifermentans TaxID=1490 RepID=UPI00038D2A3E|nr:ATPase AAA [Paraclostridium bifermentans]EQK47142.1 AAA-like domain protein [[Clostridium] bifermentans ATCC 19299] [Paraclostridium bifermentans ATCC 19299]
MKTKSIRLDKYFELVNPEYVYFKLIPHSSTRNNSSDKLAQLVNKVYLDFNKRLYKEEKKLFFKTKSKVSYYIYLEKSKIEFYFIIPKPYKRIFKDRISDTWRNIEIKEVKELPQFKEDSTKYSLRYKKEDALSLSVDKRNNELLSSTLNLLEILESETNDKLGIVYNFVPSSQTILDSFKEYHREITEKFNKHKPLDKNKKNIKYILKVAAMFLINSIDGFIDKLQTDLKQPIQNNITLFQNRELSKATTKKENCTLCRTQIVVFSESDDKHNQDINARAAAESFSIIDEDNGLVYDEMKESFDICDYKFPCEINQTSTQECSNFLAMPGRELINQFKDMEHISVLENKVPEELQKGFFRLGNVKVKETRTDSFKSDDEQLSRLGMAYLGCMGAGKTTFMTNNAYDIINKGYGLVNIDIINNCELSESIKSITPPDKLIEIDCSNPNQIQCFSYNEVSINSNMTDYEKISNAILHTQQIAVLLDSINDDASKLSPKMLKYLYAAGTIVFTNKYDASLKDILNCLTIPSKRKHFIESIKEGMHELLEDEVATLKELDKKEKDGSISNNDNKIEGIIDRSIHLKTSSHTKLAFMKSSKENLNFVELLEQNKVILIKIPESKFPSKMIRNIIATFFLSKIWLAKQILSTRKQPKTFILFDEFYKCHNCQLLYQDIFVEARKFDLVSIVALHYLNQLTQQCKEALKASGTSYLLLQGADVKAYQDLKSNLVAFGYEEEDLLNLDRYTALALIKTTKNYSAFVVNLPEPIKKTEIPIAS